MLNLNDRADHHLEMSVRVRHVLRDANIETIRDLLGCTQYELLRMPNMGRKSLRELMEELARHGLHLDKGASLDYGERKYYGTTQGSINKRRLERIAEAEREATQPWYVFCH